MDRTILSALILSFVLVGCASFPLDRTSKCKAPSLQNKAHAVKKGESLWSIACEELKDCYRWQEIQKANPALVPKKIQPGQAVALP